MSEEDTSVATRAAKRALEFQQKMQERIRDEFALSIGYERVGTRKVRGLARRAMAGDVQAMTEINLMAVRNGHQRGETKQCPVCREINHVLAEGQKKGMEGIFTGGGENA